MRIGIDAKWFFSGNPSGRVVVRNLLEEFLRISGSHQIYIFLKKEEQRLSFPFNYPNVTLIYVWGRNNMLSNLFVLPFKSRRLKLDVVLFQTFVPFLIYCKNIAFIHDCIYLSNPEYFSWIERIYFYPIKFLSRNANAIITISDNEKKRIKSYMNIDDKSIFVIHHGVNKYFVPLSMQINSQIIQVKERYALPEEYLLYVGRFNERKNLSNLIKAIANLKHRNIPLVLVGEMQGKMFNLHHLLEELSMKEKVKQIGFVEDNELPIIYAHAKVFCYVSFDEGFGLPPIESLSSGVPVVVSNSGSLPEICGDAGVYCNPNDPNDIAEKIDMLLSNENLYEQKKTTGIKVAQQYDWSKSAEKLLNIFTQVSQKE